MKNAKRRRILGLDFNAINASRVKQAEAEREEKERMKDEGLRIKDEEEEEELPIKVEENKETGIIEQHGKDGKGKKKGRGPAKLKAPWKRDWIGPASDEEENYRHGEEEVKLEDTPAIKVEPDLDSAGGYYDDNSVEDTKISARAPRKRTWMEATSDNGKDGSANDNESTAASLSTLETTIQTEQQNNPDTFDHNKIRQASRKQLRALKTLNQITLLFSTMSNEQRTEYLSMKGEKEALTRVVALVRMKIGEGKMERGKMREVLEKVEDLERELEDAGTGGGEIENGGEVVVRRRSMSRWERMVFS